MDDVQKGLILDNMIQLLELPNAALEKACKRYKDIGYWLGREGSIVTDYKPHVFLQGSFRLGTAIRPLTESDEYDLDLACILTNGFTKEIYTQEDLKGILGRELELYRTARNLKNQLEAKHRCWRLEYQDNISFHIDIVPGIPAEEGMIKSVRESILTSGVDEYIADSVSQKTVLITDDRHKNYKNICSDWNISNPEGYAKWFEYQMKPANLQALREHAQVDDIPIYLEKTALQRVIQLLKRHRDNWSKDKPDLKPISIIITTLAARAYNGESDIMSALMNVLDGMENYINKGIPKVPNPVNPKEDFADRWYRRDCSHLNLEDNFKAWLLQARIDFQRITSKADAEYICEQMTRNFSIKGDAEEIAKHLGGFATAGNIVIPKTHTIIRTETAKPWQR